VNVSILTSRVAPAAGPLRPAGLRPYRTRAAPALAGRPARP